MSGMQTGFEGSRVTHDMYVFDKRILSNGIVLWVHEPPIYTDNGGDLGVFLSGVGSRCDPVGREGTAHFFEHIPFRGTVSFPSTDAIERAVKSWGGSYNAETSISYTSFRLKLPASQYALGAKLLSDLVLHPRLSEEDVESEKGVILAEHRRGLASAVNVQGKFIRETLYANTRWMHDPVGDTAVIKSMTARELGAFHRLHYHAGNINLIVGTAFTKEPGAIQALEDAFADLPQAPPSEKPKGSSPALLQKQRGGGRHWRVDQRYGRDHLAISYLFPSTELRAFKALSLLAATLSSGMDSPLSRRLRLEIGEVYETGLCSVSPAGEFWQFLFYCPIKKVLFANAEQIFDEELARLSADEVFRAQISRQRRRELLFTHPSKACTELAHKISSFGRQITSSEASRAEDEVTLSDVFAWRDRLLEGPRDIFQMEI